MVIEPDVVGRQVGFANQGLAGAQIEGPRMQGTNQFRRAENAVRQRPATMGAGRLYGKYFAAPRTKHSDPPATSIESPSFTGRYRCDRSENDF
jgi:hypothetical protein